MPKSRPPYPAEFRARMVELARAGRIPEELSREFEPTAQSIQNCVRQAERDQGVRQDGLTTGEKEELRRPLDDHALLATVRWERNGLSGTDPYGQSTREGR